MVSPSPTTTATLSQNPTGAVGNVTFNAYSPTVAANTTTDCPSTNQLGFGGSGTITGIQVGMTVYGAQLLRPAPLLAAVKPLTSVTISVGLAAGGVTPADIITFSSPDGSTTVSAQPSAAISSGTSLTFSGALNVSDGMSVTGTNISPGTKVTAVTPPNVTIKPAAAGDVPAGSVIVFATDPPPCLLADQIFQWLPSTTSPA